MARSHRKPPAKIDPLTINHGDTVEILTSHNQLRRGKATLLGPAGWVLNMGGPHGTPAIANQHNIVRIVRRAS